MGHLRRRRGGGTRREPKSKVNHLSPGDSVFLEISSLRVVEVQRHPSPTGRANRPGQRASLGAQGSRPPARRGPGDMAASREVRMVAEEAASVKKGSVSAKRGAADEPAGRFRTRRTLIRGLRNLRGLQDPEAAVAELDRTTF